MFCVFFPQESKQRGHCLLFSEVTRHLLVASFFKDPGKEATASFSPKSPRTVLWLLSSRIQAKRPLFLFLRSHPATSCVFFLQESRQRGHFSPFSRITQHRFVASFFKNSGKEATFFSFSEVTRQLLVYFFFKNPDKEATASL